MNEEYFLNDSGLPYDTENIRFGNVILPQILFNNKPLGIVGGIEHDKNNITKVIPFINAVDIYWNGAELVSPLDTKVIETTEDLLNYIKNINETILDNIFFSSGTYDERPITNKVGYRYFVTDINKNIYWSGSEWVSDNGHPLTIFTIAPTMTAHARVFDENNIALVGEIYNWEKDTQTSSGKFDCCALKVPAGVKVTVKGSGQGNQTFAWVMLNDDNLVLRTSSTDMGGYNEDLIIYTGITPSDCTLLINVINKDATINVDGEEVSCPYWNKDGIPYEITLSSWSEFEVTDLLEDIEGLE